MSAVPTIWAYRARPARVIDGDTIDVTVDAGFANFRTERLRLLGVNAPEKRGPTHKAGLLDDEQPVMVHLAPRDDRGVAVGIDVAPRGVGAVLALPDDDAAIRELQLEGHRPVHDASRSADSGSRIAPTSAAARLTHTALPICFVMSLFVPVNS